MHTCCLLRIVHTVIKMFRFLTIYEYMLVSMNRMSGMEQELIIICCHLLLLYFAQTIAFLFYFILLIQFSHKQLQFFLLFLEWTPMIQIFFCFILVFIWITFDLLSRNHSLLTVFKFEPMLPCTVWNVCATSHLNDVKNLTHGLTDGSWSRIFCSG